MEGDDSGDAGGGVSRRVVLSGVVGAGVVVAGGALFVGRGEEPLIGVAKDIEVAVPRKVTAGVARPRVFSRKEWGARAPRRPGVVLGRGPERIVVHHTASGNSGDRSLQHAQWLSRDIQRFHMDTRHWDDVGQQLTISRGGHVLEGCDRTLEAIAQSRHAVGRQTMPDAGYNRRTLGIENEGNYMRAAVPNGLWESLVGTCAWLCTVYELDPYKAIAGHRDFISTECPGDRLYARLPELRREVARRIKES